jgi:hypothetical protein
MRLLCHGRVNQNLIRMPFPIQGCITARERKRRRQTFIFLSIPPKSNKRAAARARAWLASARWLELAAVWPARGWPSGWSAGGPSVRLSGRRPEGQASGLSAASSWPEGRPRLDGRREKHTM